MTADDIIQKLNLMPHPEGGWYRQTWVEEAEVGARPSGTAIYFLLKSGEVSHWHRIDTTEIWLFHAGAPLELRRAERDDGPASVAVLGPNLASGQLPQLIVEPNHWQSAQSLGDWSLVSCTVSPGFLFENFELAAPGFDIPVG